MPPLRADEHRGAEGLPARVLEDDVDVLAAGQLADPLAEPPPLLGVLGVLVLPEPVVLGAAVDDQLGAHPRQISALSVAGDHAHRGGAAVERELGGVAAEAAAGAPDQHVVALLHAGAVAADQLPVGGGVHQPGAGRLLPGQVRRLGHQLVGLDQGDLGQAAEVGLEAPDPLLRVEHRVVVARRGSPAPPTGSARRPRSPGCQVCTPGPVRARRRRGRSRPRGRAGRASWPAGRMRP